MKTLNTNPQLQNQPLRLNESQTQYPEAALDEFFENYHLSDVRPILWQWLKEVLYSPRESINDPHERNNDIFFYEKIESLIEAAWVLRRGYVPTINLEHEADKESISIHATSQPAKQQTQKRVTIAGINHQKSYKSPPPNLPTSQKKQPHSQLRSSMRYSIRYP